MSSPFPYRYAVDQKVAALTFIDVTEAEFYPFLRNLALLAIGYRVVAMLVLASRIRFVKSS